MCKKYVKLGAGYAWDWKKKKLAEICTECFAYKSTTLTALLEYCNINTTFNKNSIYFPTT